MSRPPLLFACPGIASLNSAMSINSTCIHCFYSDYMYIYKADDGEASQNHMQNVFEGFPFTKHLVNTD